MNLNLHVTKSTYYLVASMVLSPVADNLLINLIFVAVATTCFSFCSPSLGPTSTILTDCRELNPFYINHASIK